MNEGPNPGGLCQCGCGGLAPVAAGDSTRDGWVKGKPKRFIHGHHARRYRDEADVKGPDDCWLWQGGLDGNGYPVLHRDRRRYFAHRLAYQQRYGKSVDGLDVHHMCGEPRCVNPRHLEALSRPEHMSITHSHERPLNAERAAEIRTLVRQGWEQEDIAAAYRVSDNTVYCIGTGYTWPEAVAA